MTAIMIGVWSMVFLGALMQGVLDAMIENSIATMIGDAQIHRQGYGNDPVVENSMTTPAEVGEALDRELPTGSIWTSRIRVGAIASNARHSSGIVMVGIDPAREAAISFIGPEAVFEGRYLDDGDEHGIVVGKALVDKFETKLGNKLVLMSQDTDKEVASRAFRIVGIYRAEMEGTEKVFAFVTAPAADKMLKLGGAVSEFAIGLEDHDMAEEVVAGLKTALPETYEIETWRELSPFLNAYLELNNVFTYIWFLVMFIAMSFGIINTTLMAIFERMREFGLMKALGMKPWWIIRDVLTESFFLLIMGMAAGTVLALLTSWWLAGSGINLSALAEGVEYFGMPRIIYPEVNLEDIIAANAIVLVLGLVVCLYPAARAARLSPIEALARN